LLWIAREVHGRIPPTALFALPLAYSYPFQFGFVNFALSIGSVEDLVSNLYRRVVLIVAITEENGEEQIAWYGSGTIISPNGLILTNAHVVLPDSETQIKDLAIFVTLAPEKSPELRYYAEVLQADVRLDLAVLRIVADAQHQPIDPDTLYLPYVRLGDSDLLQLGDPIVILGYPGIGGTTITLTKGEVSGFTAEEGIDARAFIKTSATIAGGNSGGLAANSRGQLIGIPTRLGSGTEGEVVDCRW
ncbi:MAG: S1C family serine protease, partial [Anaerolineales bacterium]